MLSKKLISSLAIILASNLIPARMLHAGSPNKKDFPVHWVLHPGANPDCPLLNPGVTAVTGDGEQHLTSQVTKNPDGTYTMRIQSVATGQAVDNNGTKYSWAYVNHLTFALTTPTLPSSGNFTGHFSDSFNLVSHGKSPNIKSRLDWDVIVQIFPGEPLSEIPFNAIFVSGTTQGDPYCDPL
jgi:hypothetical protein